MLAQNTIRNQLIERFTSEFGQAATNDKIHVWSVQRSQQSPLHVWMDSFMTPNEVGVWLFDPSRGEATAAECIKIREEHEIGPLIDEINSRVR